MDSDKGRRTFVGLLTSHVRRISVVFDDFSSGFRKFQCVFYRMVSMVLFDDNTTKRTFTSLGLLTHPFNDAVRSPD